MALQTKTGTFTLKPGPAAAFTVEVGFTPTALILWSTQQKSIAGSESSAYFAMGFGTSNAHQYAVSARTIHGATSSSVRSDYYETRILFAEGANVLLNLSNFTGTGFTLTPASQVEAAQPIHYLAIGGTDKRGSTTFAPTAGTGLQTIGISAEEGGGTFQPDFCLVLCAGFLSPNAEHLACVGAASGVSNQACSTLQVRRPSNSVVQTYNRDDHLFCIPKAADGTVGYRVKLNAFNAGGVQIDKIVSDYNPPGGGLSYFILALKFTAGDAAEVGSLLTQTSTGLFSKTGMSFKPKSVMFVGTGQPENTDDTAFVTGTAGFSVGGANNNAEQASAWHGIEHDVSAQNASSQSSRAEIYQNRSANAGVPSVNGLVSLKSMNSDGFTLDQTDADPTSQKFLWYAALGSTAVADTPGTAPDGIFDPEMVPEEWFDNQIQGTSLFDAELADVAGEAQNYHETPTETVSLSESVAAVTHNIVGLSETVSLSESLSSLAAFKPTVSETVSTAESLASNAVMASALPETVSLDESLSSLAAFVGPLSETVSLSESLNSLAQFQSELSESVTVAESLFVSRHVAESVNDTVTLSDSETEIYGAKPQVSESVPLSESSTTLAVMASVLPETVSLSEQTTTLAVMHSELQETVSVSEATFASQGTAQSVSETVSLSEALNALAQMHSTLSETVTLSESLAAIQSTLAALSESVAVSELLSSAYSAKPGVSETVSLSESFSVSQHFAASPSESVSLSDSLGSVYHAIVSPNETVTFSEAISVGGSTAYSEDLSETVSLSESISLSYVAKAFVVETVDLQEALSVVRTQVVLLSDSASLSESLVPLARAIIPLGEALQGPSEALQGSMGFEAALGESLGVSGALETLSHFHPELSENVPLSEAVSSGSEENHTVSLSETVPSSESIAVPIGRHAFLTEALSLGESIGALSTVGRRSLAIPSAQIEQHSRKQVVKEESKTSLLNKLKGR